jgi:hypothetical protein
MNREELTAIIYKQKFASIKEGEADFLAAYLLDNFTITAKSTYGNLRTLESKDTPDKNQEPEIQGPSNPSPQEWTKKAKEVVERLLDQHEDYVNHCTFCGYPKKGGGCKECLPTPPAEIEPRIKMYDLPIKTFNPEKLMDEIMKANDGDVFVVKEENVSPVLGGYQMELTTVQVKKIKDEVAAHNAERRGHA